MMTDEEVTKKFADVHELLDKQHDRLTRLLRLTTKVLDLVTVETSQTLVKKRQGTP